MKLGYKTDENGKECLHTSIVSTRIRELDVEIYVTINRDLSYPLSSPHNNGYRIKIIGTNEPFNAEFNIEAVADEQALIEVVNSKFNSSDQFVKIANAKPGETFAFESKVYNKTAIDKQCYDDWDYDLEDLQDNADKVVSVFLNDQLRWEVAKSA